MTKVIRRVSPPRFWIPTTKANVVQIGERITRRKPRETVSELLERAIRDYPNRSAELVVIGWR
ncbi:MAG TPA: hypothetical protein VFC18_09660 [Burkholderiales bacterium]|nr:hypothetical protein [Burkholderiales bacterium]